MKRLLFLLGVLLIAHPALAQEHAQPTGEGTMVRRVAAPYLDLRMAALSPDGHYLSYVEWDSANLALHDLTSGENRNLTHDGSWSEPPQFAYFSTISPDGKHVAYSWFYQFRGRGSPCDLRIVGLDGSRPRVLYHNKEIWAEPSAWSPDGKYILANFTIGKDGIDQIVLVSVADGSVRVLKTPYDRPHTYGIEMSFSPDGRNIAFNLPHKNSPGHDIFLLSVDDGREIPLVQHPANDLFLGWAPDGRHILFTSDRTGTLGAWVIRVVDGKPDGMPELVKPDLGPNFMPVGFTQKGSYYYGVFAAKTDLYLAPLDPAAGKLLAPPTLVKQLLGFDISPEWSPDGKHLAYVTQRGPGVWGEVYPLSLWIRSLGTGKEREIPLKMRRHFELQPRWSLDGRSFLLDGEAKGHGGHRIDAETGNITTIWTAAVDDRGWSAWSADGKGIFYRRGLKILLRDLQTGQEKQLYALVSPSELGHLAVSPDGQRLAFLESDAEKGATTLKVIPATGGEPRELLTVQRPETISRLDWRPDGRHVVFDRSRSSRNEQEFELWRIPADGGEPQPLGLAMKGVRLYGLRIHPDGRRIVFTTGRASGYSAFEVWVLKDFVPGVKPSR